MKIKCNNEYYKILETEIPNTYQEFLQILSEIVGLKLLPSNCYFHYRDLEGFPIKVGNSRTYNAMLEEKKKFQTELILEIIFEEKPEKLTEGDHIGQISHGLTNKEGHDVFKEENKEPEVPAFGKEDDANISAFINYNSMPSTIDETVFSTRSQREGKEEILHENLVVNENSQVFETSEERMYSRIIYTLENVEFVVSEADALKEGLSGRLEKARERVENADSEKEMENRDLDSQKESWSSESEKSRSEISQKDQIKIQYSEDKDEKESESEEDDDLYIVSKKIKTTPGGLYKDDCIKLDERIMKLQNKWKGDYLIEYERSRLKVIAASWRENRSKLKRSVNDQSIQRVISELIEIMKLYKIDPSENIVNLSIHLKDCANFSRNGLAGLLQMINLNFGGVCILNLDFSFSEKQEKQRNSRNQEKLSLELQNLRNLTLNFKNRVDVENTEIDKLLNRILMNSKQSLRSLNIIQNEP